MGDSQDAEEDGEEDIAAEVGIVAVGGGLDGAEGTDFEAIRVARHGECWLSLWQLAVGEEGGDKEKSQGN